MPQRISEGREGGNSKNSAEHVQREPNVQQLTVATAHSNPRDNEWKRRQSTDGGYLEWRIVGREKLDARIHQRQRTHRDNHRGDAGQIICRNRI